MTRREALSLLGVGAGAAFGLRAAAAQEPTQAASKLWRPFPPGAIIRTLVEDVSPEALSGGPTLFHERLPIDFSTSTLHSANVALMVEEARGALNDGLACFVDGGHPDVKRDLGMLRRIATESGLPIVATGGYHLARTRPAEIGTNTADQIADSLVKDAVSQRFGAYGAIGPHRGALTIHERTALEAIGKAQARNGLPIITLNASSGKRPVQSMVLRDEALRQLDVLETVGATPRNIAIGHVCGLDDPNGEVVIALAKRGVFVRLDRITPMTIPAVGRVATAMAEAGYCDQLLLSSDCYSAPALKKNGGPGLAQPATVFGPMLLKGGMDEATLRGIFVENPRRFLAFRPKES